MPARQGATINGIARKRPNGIVMVLDMWFYPKFRTYFAFDADIFGSLKNLERDTGRHRKLHQS
jgi:hypothetical protein